MTAFVRAVTAFVRRIVPKRRRSTPEEVAALRLARVRNERAIQIARRRKATGNITEDFVTGSGPYK